MVTGPIFDPDIEILCKDEEHANVLQKRAVEIPDSCYKIMVDELNGAPRILAFIIPQTAIKEAQLVEFLTSVDEIEQLTGFDFFWKLDDVLEECLESKPVTQLW